MLGLTAFSRSAQMIGLEAGAFRVFLDRGPPYGPVFDFYVDDLAAAKARLVAAGCRMDEDDPSIPRCYVRDPFGLTFNIEERKGAGASIDLRATALAPGLGSAD